MLVVQGCYTLLIAGKRIPIKAGDEYLIPRGALGLNPASYRDSSGHSVEVETEGRKQSIAIASKSTGRGSSVNGGELLFAALATCFCNDLYREAAKRGIEVHGVEVEVTGTFGNPGEPARDISYRVQVRADASQTEIDDLIRATDTVTEIQNTLRAGCAVRLVSNNAGL
jgi:uncharacterized OsmC-like protein